MEQMHIVIKPNILPMVLRNRLKSSLKQIIINM